MAGGKAGDRSLKETPTWAVAVVCAVIVVVSVLLEQGIHHLHKLFHKRKKKAMLEALEKIKAELMLMGFISLLLTVSQQPISKICVPTKVGMSMLPCRVETHQDRSTKSGGGDHKRKLLEDYASESNMPWRRVLAGGAREDYCSKFDGKVSLISQSGIHQLHIFIFVLAVLHVLYSLITMRLAQAKVRKWKAWESETTSLEYQFSNDPQRFRFTRQTSFVRRHGGLYNTPGIKWIVAFFRQFKGSVTKVDYLTLRHGFINAHLAPHRNFNFYKYIRESMEDDLKRIVGVSLPLWFLAVTLMLLNVYGWYSLYWISFVPLVILLVVGTKLELVIMKLAHQIQDTTAVVAGAPIVQPSNELFWFGHPEWILKLIHLTLFESAFQLAHFLWTWYSFGLKSCFHMDLPVILMRVILGLALLFLCSYVTFPLYAFVTQMGSEMKKTIFEEQTAKAFHKWRQVAVERSKLRELGIDITSGYMSRESTPSRSSSPIPMLHRYKSDSTTDVKNVAPNPQPAQYLQPGTGISEEQTPSFVIHSDAEPRRPAPRRLNDKDDSGNFSLVARP